MKKLLLIILPLLMLISVFFYFTNQTFNFAAFLDVISEWNFTNSYDILLEIKEEFSSSLHTIEVGRENQTLLAVDGIFSLLKNVIMLPVSLLRVAVSYILELVNNVGSVLGYLLGW